MRKTLLLMLLAPQVMMAQYEGDCFKMEGEGIDMPFETTIRKDTTFVLDFSEPIHGFYVTGASILNDNKSFVRIILKDEYGYEHLVYENNYLLSSPDGDSFYKTALETKVLDEKIVPKSMRMEVGNATLQLSAISYATTHSSPLNSGQLRKKQNEFIIQKTNATLTRRHLPWRAGETGVSEMTYEEKKGMMGGRLPQLYGFEYYVGGVYISPTMMDGEKRGKSSSDYASEWDWRNRHGRNWLSAVRNQHMCGACWAFAGIGVLEAYTNLYYNQVLNFDLSEQDVISCNGVYHYIGGDPGIVLDYAKNHGIVDEACFPYNTGCTLPDCSNKCDAPSNITSIQDYTHVVNIGENAIKRQVIKAPLTIGLYSINHIMVLAGYKTLEVGDTIHFSHSFNTDCSIDSIHHQQYIGQAAWLVKNSWGEDWGENGYGYVCTDIGDIFLLYAITGNATSTTLSDSDIVCEDRDGDGYFNWGLGPKPPTCPDWVSDEPDGDDTDVTVGPIDEYGRPTIIDCSGAGVETVNSSQTIAEDRECNYDVVVLPNVTLTIKGDWLFHYGAHLTVKPGAIVNVDGGKLISARISQESGSQMNVVNGGTIIPPARKRFAVPIGSKMRMTKGRIESAVQ